MDYFTDVKPSGRFYSYICAIHLKLRTPMRLLVDDKIPYIRPALDRLPAEVIYLSASDFTPDAVREADALLVRTRTRCDRSLLEGSRVCFIATATIGHDHIDAEYCRSQGIEWTNAPGCNAASVCQYVVSTLLWWSRRRGRSLRGMRLGVVGVGHVGRLVAEAARELGMEVLLNDPPRQRKEGKGFVELNELATQCDVLTFHVPLTTEGPDATHHLADECFLAGLHRRPLLINTSRGEVVDGFALHRALDAGWVSDAVLDVWEHEPKIDLALLDKVFLGTPHIAGYSADGKANASRMVLEALCRRWGWAVPGEVLPPDPSVIDIHAASWEEAALQAYNPHTDSLALKSHPEDFELLRGHYPLRRELRAYRLHLVPRVE